LTFLYLPSTNNRPKYQEVQEEEEKEREEEAGRQGEEATAEAKGD
jgi:hypothetical protein